MRRAARSGSVPVLLLICALVLASCDELPRRARGSNADDAPPFDAPALEQRIHDLLNAERAANGLQPLDWDDALADLALAHSEDMAARGFFEHVNPEGLDVTARGEARGIVCRHGGRIGLGENLARTAYYSELITYSDGDPKHYEWRTIEEVARVTVQGWMASEGHRRNVLDPGYFKHGIGAVMDAEFRIYITDNFC